MHEVTRILTAIDQSDPHAAEQLLPHLCKELRALSVRKTAKEKPGQSLQATALAHEADLRMVGGESTDAFRNRGQFLAAAVNCTSTSLTPK